MGSDLVEVSQIMFEHTLAVYTSSYGYKQDTSDVKTGSNVLTQLIA